MDNCVLRAYIAPPRRACAAAAAAAAMSSLIGASQGQGGAWSGGQIIGSVRAAFGLFVTDAVLADGAFGGDSVELLMATASVIAALWKYMEIIHDWKESACALNKTGAPSDDCSAHWRVATVVYDLALLVESACAILAVRILTQAAEDSVGATGSKATYIFVSLMVFVAIDTVSKLRRRVPGGTSATAVQMSTALARGNMPTSGMMWGFAG
jgi:hypothetical protein